MERLGLLLEGLRRLFLISLAVIDRFYTRFKRR
jgi:hypothetical protein